jgi:predicted transcriptional regulator
MVKKYTKNKRGGNTDNLQIHFNELEMIVEKINSDVKELKNQMQNIESNNVEEKSTVEENLGENKEYEKPEEPEEFGESEVSEEKDLSEKKEEIMELINKANKMLYVDDNCNLKMKQKPCSTGKDTLDGFERALNKSDFNDSKANALKINVENYVNKIKNDLGIKGGRIRKTKKMRKHRKKMTRKRN